MKVTFITSQLQDALSAISNLPSSTKSDSVLSSFNVVVSQDMAKIRALNSTNSLDVTVMVSVVECDKDFQFTAPSTEFAKTVKNLKSDNVTFAYNEQTRRLRVSTKGGKAQIYCYDSSDYMPSFDLPDDSFLIHTDMFTDIYQKTGHVSATTSPITTVIALEMSNVTDDNGVVVDSELSGFTMDGITRIACSFNRSIGAVVEPFKAFVTNQDFKQVASIISGFATQQSVYLAVSDNHLYVLSDNMRIKIVCVSISNLPNYRDIFPAQVKVYVEDLPVMSLITAINWVSSFGPKKLHLDFDPGGFIYVSMDQTEAGNAEKTIDANVILEDSVPYGVLTHVNEFYTHLSAMSRVGVKHVNIYMADSGMPIIVSPSDRYPEHVDWMVVAMPVHGKTNRQKESEITVL